MNAGACDGAAPGHCTRMKENVNKRDMLLRAVNRKLVKGDVVGCVCMFDVTVRSYV